jgi:hypothetical protein
MPLRGIQHPKSVAGLPRFLNRVTRFVRLVAETVDDPVQVLVHCLGSGRWENQSVVRRVAAIPLEAGEQKVADCDDPLFIIFGLEAELGLKRTEMVLSSQLMSIKSVRAAEFSLPAAA